MAYLCFAASFSYYMTNLEMKYLPGNIYSNNYALATGEIFAYLFGYCVYNWLGDKKAVALGFLISLVGGILILSLGDKLDQYMPVFILIARFGIGMNFNTFFISMASIFPTLFVGTAFGICNFIARGLTVVAPFVAEIQEPTPMIIFCLIQAVGLILAWFINTDA